MYIMNPKYDNFLKQISEKWHGHPEALFLEVQLLEGKNESLKKEICQLKEEIRCRPKVITSYDNCLDSKDAKLRHTCLFIEFEYDDKRINVEAENANIRVSYLTEDK